MDAFFTKLPNASFIPASEDDAELLTKVKVGETVKLTLTRPRNIKFHRKFFALMNLAYDYWDPPISAQTDGIGTTYRDHHHGIDYTVQKDPDRFRKDICILAGYYDATYRLNGDVRLEAKSISFGSMDEDTFEKLYSKVIDVIINRICTQYTSDQLRRQVEDMVLNFV